MAAAALRDMKDDGFLVSSIQERYQKELELGRETHSIKLEYAWCLLRSPKVVDMRHGLNLIVELIFESARSDIVFRKRCQYCLAVGYARLKDYPGSFRVIRVLREMDPEDFEWEELWEAIDKKRFRGTSGKDFSYRFCRTCKHCHPICYHGPPEEIRGYSGGDRRLLKRV